MPWNSTKPAAAPGRENPEKQESMPICTLAQALHSTPVCRVFLTVWLVDSTVCRVGW